MNSSELRQKFLSFFEKRGHTIIPSASLIPDQTGAGQKTLFVTAGMQPLIPFLLGEKHPKGKRLVNVQKCIRTGDIDEVGDDTHLTFFEMLGNWSLGDYWKKESIEWSYEFLTKELQISADKLAVSCFAGDKNASKDDESAEIWKSLGISEKRIAFLPKEDNWWGPVGETGPCGPDTEIFYWKSNTIPIPATFDPKDKNWVEIWNNVFMEYVKDSNGKYVVADQKNVDTGMGLERTLAILNGYETVFQTDLFVPIMNLVSEDGNFNEKQRKIIADHSRAIAFLIAAGVKPSNKDQGYVLRRLIRRLAIFWIYQEQATAVFSFMDALKKVAASYKSIYPELDLNEIEKVYKEEDQNFIEAFHKGREEYSKLKVIDTQSAFYLYQSFGLPYEVIKELDPEKSKNLKYEDFVEELKKHQELSRTSSAGMFKGGLADHEPKTIKLHTAHHLLLAALQELFGAQVKQKGSNINQERLRIDFSFDRKLTNEEKQKLEDMVNERIQQGLDVIKREMPREKAEKIGAQMEFGVKYGNTVSVYFIEDKKGNAYSKEFCGGPHVHNTSELGRFKIAKEEAVSAGVRRIKAILE